MKVNPSAHDSIGRPAVELSRIDSSGLPGCKVEAPNHGFVLRDGHRIVGAFLAFYSERLVAGRVERFCDLGPQFVLPDFRSHSLRLLKALLAQQGYHFTSLQPGEKVVSINTRLKFRSLDTSAALIPNLPWPSLPGRTRISADPDVIENTLAGTELKIYHNHAQDSQRVTQC